MIGFLTTVYEDDSGTALRSQSDRRVTIAGLLFRERRNSSDLLSTFSNKGRAMHSDQITKILLPVAKYGTLTRAMLQGLVFPGVDDRSVRKVLLQLVQRKYVGRTQAEVVFPDQTAATPVYYPIRQTFDFLACATGDESWQHMHVSKPNWMFLAHAIDTARFRILLDKAVALQTNVQIERCFTENQVANPEETEPSKRFTGYTLISEKPKLCCVPDLGFMARQQGICVGFYGEIDRATTGLQAVAASKTPGYASMAQRKLHARHFPEAAKYPFTVFMVTPTVGRRDQLAKAISPKPGAVMWKFASWPELTPENLLHGPVFRNCEGQPVPLMRNLSETYALKTEGPA